MGSWIWASQTFDKQAVRLWKTFAIPRGARVTQATLWIAVDNGYQLYLDGQQIGQGSDWRWPTKYDVTLLLKPGRHVLAVAAFNDSLAAGVILGLQVKLAAQPSIRVESDNTWRIATTRPGDWMDLHMPPSKWPSATVVGKIHKAPWSPWPMGIIVGPRLHPVVVSFWQTKEFQISLALISLTAVLACLWLLVELASRSKVHRLLHLQRARIARDIHDDLGARLTHLTLQGELLQNELPTQSVEREKVDRICEAARELANAMDEVVWAVSSRRDTLRDFAEFTCRYAQRFLRDTPLRCRLDIEPDLPHVPFELPIRRNLLLAVKEAISNAAKYSNSTKLILRIHRHNKGVRVVVEDRGSGFDLSNLTSGRNGLTNMELRMQEVGGQFAVHTVPGGGCRVQFTVPLTHGRRQSWWGHRFNGNKLENNELEQKPTVIESEPNTNPTGDQQ